MSSSGSGSGSNASASASSSSSSSSSSNLSAGGGGGGGGANSSSSSSSSSKGVLTLNYSHGLLYSLIVRQLYDDGFIDLAKVVANSTNTMIDREFTSKQLASLVQQALGEGKATSDGSKVFGLTKEEDDLYAPDTTGNTMADDTKGEATKLGASSLSVCVTGSSSLYGANVRDSKTPATSAAAGGSAAATAALASSSATSGAASSQRKSKVFPVYQSKYTAQHKNAVTCARFSADGTFAVTGSADCTLRILEVSKMHYNVQASKTENPDDAANRPIYRAYFDHSDVVNDADFHPLEPFLASASKDGTIKLFDHSKITAKRATKQINESHAVRSIAFHPAGDYLLAATEHQMIRLYDVSTFQAFVSPDTTAHHFGAINHVRWSTGGQVYASCAKDGHVKVWDTVSNRCVVTVRNAHGGSEVASVAFSSSGKYLLTAGKDSVVRLWDVGSGKQVLYYTGAHQQKYRMHAAFDHTQDFVLSPDESTGNLIVWDTRTGELLKKMSAHSKPIRCLVTSPTEPSFISCGEDQRAKFWSSID